MASPDRSSLARDALQKILTLKKKQSWFGSIRQAVAQSASTAKAAVDTLRERIEYLNPAEPGLHLLTSHSGTTIEEAQDKSPTKECKASPSTHQLPQLPQLRHRRTLTPKTALASIRSHWSRRSVDSKYPGLSDVFHRPGSRSNGIRGPEDFYGSSHQNSSPAPSANLVPLPSSPINIPARAPSLALDLGPAGFMLPSKSLSERTGLQDRQKLQDPPDIVTGKPVSPAKLVGFPALDATQIQPQSFILDPLQPTAEARRSPAELSLAQALQTPVDSCASLSFGSPIPGTSMSLELDGQSKDEDKVLEPTAASNLDDIAHKALSLDAVADSDIEDYESIALPSPLIKEHEHPGLRKDEKQQSLVPPLAPTPTKPSSRSSSGHKWESTITFEAPEATKKDGQICQAIVITSPATDNIPQRGVPSPERSVRIPFRPKPTAGEGPSFEAIFFKPVLERTLSKSSGMRATASTGSLTSKSHSPFKRDRTNTVRYDRSPYPRPNEDDLTVSLLRERTSDSFVMFDSTSTRSINSIDDSLFALSGTAPANITALNDPASSSSPSVMTKADAADDTSSPMRTPSMGDREQFDLARSEREARYNSLLDEPKSNFSSSSSDGNEPRFGQFQNPSPHSKSSSPTRPLGEAAHNRYALLEDLNDGESDEDGEQMRKVAEALIW